MKVVLGMMAVVGLAPAWACRGKADGPASGPPQTAPTSAEARGDDIAAPAPTPETAAVAEPRGTTCPLLSAATTAPARVSATWHEGAQGYDQAQRERGATRAPMVVYFRTDWCGYCRQFEAGLLNRPAAQSYLGGRVVKVRVNPESGRRDSALAERLGVAGFPTFLVVTGDDAGEAISPFVDEGLRIRVMTPGEFESAIEKVIAASVEDGLARSEALIEGGDAPGSIALLDDAIGLDPRRAEAYFRRGLAHWAARSSGRAFADFRRALELKPDFPDVYRSTGQWLARDGRWDEIIDCWSDYIGRAPESAAGYLERGGAYRRKGDRARARADAEKACSLGESRACEDLRRLSS